MGLLCLFLFTGCFHSPPTLPLGLPLVPPELDEGEEKKEAGKDSSDWRYSSHLHFLVPSFLGPWQLVPSCSWWVPEVCLTRSLCPFWLFLYDFSLPCCPSIWLVLAHGNLRTRFALTTWGKRATFHTASPRTTISAASQPQSLALWGPQCDRTPVC